MKTPPVLPILTEEIERLFLKDGDFMPDGVPAAVQQWLKADAERQRDFELLQWAARDEDELLRALDYFEGNNDYDWPLLMICAVTVGDATETGDEPTLQLGMAAMRLLLAAGADANFDAALYGSPLHYACRCGYLDMAALLLWHGASVRLEDVDGWTPLHYAAYNGRLDCAELLFKHGAPINAPDLGGTTPLYWAIAGNHPDMVKLLQKRGARITQFTQEDWERYGK